MTRNIKKELKRIAHGRNKLAQPLFIVVLLLFASPALAGYLNAINLDRLPKEATDILSQLRELEPYVEEWQVTWSHSRSKEGTMTRVKELYERSESLLAKNPENGELLLLCGLIAFYGHNVNLDNFSERADAHFASAQKVLTNDYRPLWLLGMHLAKSTRCAEGMKALLEAERKYSIREPLFWDDYAAAAYFTAMFNHSLQALGRVRELSGRESRLEDIFGDKIRAAAKTPKPNEKIQAQNLWQSSVDDTAVTIVSFPFGYKFSVQKKEDRDFQTTNFDGRFAVLQVRLTPHTGTEGVIRIPTLQVATFIAQEKETLENFTKRFLNKSAKWQNYEVGLGLGEVAYTGESSEYYKTDGGVKVVMVAFERNSPKISGLLLEEPRGALKGANSGFYRINPYYQRFKERLFYQIWLETPMRFFDQTLAEFKAILKTFMVE